MKPKGPKCDTKSHVSHVAMQHKGPFQISSLTFSNSIELTDGNIVFSKMYCFIINQVKTELRCYLH